MCSSLTNNVRVMKKSASIRGKFPRCKRGELISINITIPRFAFCSEIMGTNIDQVIAISSDMNETKTWTCSNSKVHTELPVHRVQTCELFLHAAALRKAVLSVSFSQIPTLNTSFPFSSVLPFHFFISAFLYGKI